ncbi:hypothetical protein D3C72_587200 [compost metagenome]
MRITLAVKDRHGPFFVIRIDVCRVERCHRRRRIGGVQVDLLRRGGGGLRRHQRVWNRDRLRVRTGLNGWWCTSNRVAGQLQALHVHQVTVFVEFELTVTAVKHRTVFIDHTEETVLADSHIQPTASVSGGAVGKVLGDTRNFNAQTHFRTGKHVRERRSTGFETIGRGVGDVVANDVQVGGRSIQAADRLRKGHDLLLISVKA